MPSDLYGPFGALVILGLVVTGLSKVVQALWADHKRADAADRERADRALAGWEAETQLNLAIAGSTNRLAAAVEKRNQADAKRVRASDA
jgi:hypothetical protein